MLAIFAASSGAQLAADIAEAEANGDATNTINLAVADYQVDNLLIQNQNAAVPAKTLTITGVGENSSLLDGAGIGRVLDINASNGKSQTVVLKDLTIEHGTITGSAGRTAQGGGLYMSGQNGRATLSNVGVRSNVASGAMGSNGANGSGTVGSGQRRR